jgi:hypothetical protein
MATKADKVHAEEIKKPVKAKKARKLAQRKPKHSEAEPIAAGKKATVAKEETAKGKRPSRKSTRKSANRGKSDSNLTLRSERAKNAPTARAREAKGKAVKTRGKAR